MKQDRIRCPQCNRVVSIKGGVVVKHRVKRSPSHCQAVKTGSRRGTHRAIRVGKDQKAAPVCSHSYKTI